MRVDRYLAVERWARARYTRDGMLTISGARSVHVNVPSLGRTLRVPRSAFQAGELDCPFKAAQRARARSYRNAP